ncbi:hypothetical protein AAC387_Pa04g1276 [Persea americana]
MEVRSFFREEGVALERMLCSVMEVAVVETALVAEKPVIRLLLEIGSLLKEIDVLLEGDDMNQKGFLNILGRIKHEVVQENQDGGEIDDDDEDDEDDGDDQDDDGIEDDSSSDEDNEGDGDDDDDDLEANGEGESEEDDDDDDEDDDDEDDEDDNEEDDEEDDEEEAPHPPSKKMK